MTIKRAVSVFLLTILCISVIQAQQSTIEQANQILNQKGQVSFIVDVQNKAQLDELSKVVTIERKQTLGDKILVLADRNRFDSFLKMNIPFELPEELNKIVEQAMYDRSMSSQPYVWDAYPTYPEYLAMMDDFGTNYPAICQKIDLGNTVQGRELLAVKISDNVSTNENEPRFLYVSSMHGDEICGYVLMLRLIDYMLTNYGTDPEITDLIDNNEIWISPLHNPDGCYWGGNNTVSGAIRYNANGVDLNRNYPDPQDGMHSDGQSYQVETMAYMALAEQYHFVLSANHHGGAEVVNYPWDTFQNLVADEDYWLHVCHEYTDTVHSVNATYMDGFDDGVTNGYDWYEVAGGRQDYMNYDMHCRELTTELSNQKTPPASSLPNYWDYNYRSLINYMKEVENGIRGVITDANTGNPIEATAYISSKDILNTWVKTELPHGDYYRPIKAGTYDVTFDAPCYESQTISVSVSDFSSTTLDVALVPLTENPVASDVNINSGETATLNATLSGTANWYTSTIAPTPIFVGNPFVTPALTSSTTYYIENEVIPSPLNVPSPSNTSNGSYYTGDRYLIFDCFEAVTLNKVTVNAQNAGTMTVTLEDYNGNTLESTSVSLTVGVQEIDLDFSIPIGRDMRLIKSTASTGLYRNNNNVSYPYELDRFINIKNSDAGSSYYYNFYDWEVQRVSCVSDRIEVNVIVNTGDVQGCTDSSACNYDSTATIDDGSCENISCAGCTDVTACNYNNTATIDDGTCILPDGCTDSSACNYDNSAQCDNGSCEYVSCAGCTDMTACNYNNTATIDDGTCILPDGCTNSSACNYDNSAQCDNGSCEYVSCAGCTNMTACNYNSAATIDDGSCTLPDGCTDSSACNYDNSAQCDNGSCEYISCAGCTNMTACNYNSAATIDDGSCTLPDGCTDSGACNYNNSAQCDNGSCEYISCAGCTDLTACNYNSAATIDNGTCILPDGCTDSSACNYNNTAQCDNGSCEYISCAGCTDLTACNYNSTVTIDNGSCEYSSCIGCLGDFNDDGFVNIGDLLVLLSDFGCIDSCIADLNNDGLTNSADLLIFNTQFGVECD